MTRFLFGPSGWSYPDWEGPVYPAGAGRAFERLAFIAGQFDFVEVNTTFYRIPAVRLAAGWVQKTAGFPDFRFWIKAYRGFSHAGLTPPENEVKLFLEALQPLNESGKLAGILLQFPYSFHCRRPQVDYLAALGDLFAGYRLALEFRHASWNRPELFEMLNGRGWVFCNIDQPQISANLPLTARLTSPEAVYFRLHGRNAAAWFAGAGRDARYDYLYPATELEEIANLIKGLADRVPRVYVAGNNHYRGQALLNLRQLKNILSQVGGGPAG